MVLVTLQGLRATEYNGCVARVLEPETAGDTDRVPVFVYRHRKGIKVRSEHLAAGSLEDALEAVCHALAADELPLTLKDLATHRDFYEPGGPGEPSIVMGPSQLPPFSSFLAPQEYRTRLAAGEAADCTSVAMVFRLAVRMCGIPQLSHLFWFPDIEDCNDVELRMQSETTGGLARLVRLEELRAEVDAFFRTPRPLGLLVSHSEGLTDLDHGCNHAEPFHGHYLTVLQVGSHFRVVHAFGLKPPPTLISLGSWLKELQPDWLDVEGMCREWNAWMIACTAPYPEMAAQAASAFFRKPFKALQPNTSRADCDISAMILTDLNPESFLCSLEEMLRGMHAVVASSEAGRT